MGSTVTQTSVTKHPSIKDYILYFNCEHTIIQYQYQSDGVRMGHHGGFQRPIGHVAEGTWCQVCVLLLQSWTGFPNSTRSPGYEGHFDP